jgi:hypothetical protein
MKRDPDYKTSWKDYAQIMLICVGVGACVYIGIVLLIEWGWL